MTTWLITGGIASGKSTVCARLRSAGFPVYDCDSRCKALYDEIPGLKESIESVTGLEFSRLPEVFGDPSALMRLEALVHPLVVEDVRKWISSQERCRDVFVESATALSKPVFKGVFDKVLLVRAPLEARLGRNAKVVVREHFQILPEESQAHYIIDNSSTRAQLFLEVDRFIEYLKSETKR